MTVVFPESVAQLGNTSVKVVQAIATPSAPSLATEINAVTSVDVSCFLFSGGAGTSTQSKGEAPPRLCTVNQFQNFGRTTYEVSDLSYVYSPQGDDTDEANAAKEALTEGSDVYLVVRKGLSAQTAAYAASQLVDIWHVRLGTQNRTQTGDGEFDVYSIQQSVIVLSEPLYDVAIAA